MCNEDTRGFSAVKSPRQTSTGPAIASGVVMDKHPFPYENALPLFKNGDVILAVGPNTNAIASGIRAMTGGIKSMFGDGYTHAAVLRMDYGFPVVYEAVAAGTIDRHLGEWKSHGYKMISVFSSDDVDVSRMMEYLIANKGKAYDVAQIGRIWWQETFRHLASFDGDDPDKFICSEYVSGALEAGGVDPCPNKLNGFTYPSDLATSPALRHVLDFTL